MIGLVGGKGGSFRPLLRVLGPMCLSSRLLVSTMHIQYTLSFVRGAQQMLKASQGPGQEAAVQVNGSTAVRMYTLLVLARLANHSAAVQMDAVREGAGGWPLPDAYKTVTCCDVASKRVVIVLGTVMLACLAPWSSNSQPQPGVAELPSACPVCAALIGCCHGRLCEGKDAQCRMAAAVRSLSVLFPLSYPRHTHTHTRRTCSAPPGVKGGTLRLPSSSYPDSYSKTHTHTFIHSHFRSAPPGVHA